MADRTSLARVAFALVAIASVASATAFAPPSAGAQEAAERSPSGGGSALGDGTYQFWWEKWGCTVTVHTLANEYDHAEVTGSWKIWAQAAGGGNKIGKIRFDWALVVPTDNNLLSRQDSSRVEVKVKKDRTSPAWSAWSVNKSFTDISKPVTSAQLIYKISWRKWYGKFGVGFWKTKKKTADIYPGSVINNLSGNQVLSDTKNWVLGNTCAVRTVNG